MLFKSIGIQAIHNQFMVFCMFHYTLHYFCILLSCINLTRIYLLQLKPKRSKPAHPPLTPCMQEPFLKHDYSVCATYPKIVTSHICANTSWLYGSHNKPCVREQPICTWRIYMAGDLYCLMWWNISVSLPRYQFNQNSAPLYFNI
jgi:hypothetical protein